MRILVCGGRDYADDRAVRRVLDAALRSGSVEIIQGGARGADTFARIWAADHGVLCTTYKADWEKYGVEAGPIRNRQMLDEGQPSLILAFPGGAGTRNMTNQAQSRGVLVIRYPPTAGNKLPFDLE
jgi:hypothetical protein